VRVDAKSRFADSGSSGRGRGAATVSADLLAAIGSGFTAKIGAGCGPRWK